MPKKLNQECTMGQVNEKIFIDALQMERDCWGFAKKIYTMGEDFDIFSGITRGGAQISIYMQEVFALLSGKPKDFTTIHAQSYTGIAQAGEVSVENIESLKNRMKKGKKLLIVDDIFDRGKTFKAVYEKVIEQVDCNKEDVKIAALYYKPENTQVDIVPDFFYRTYASSDWLVLPHELDALSKEELAAKGFIFPQS